MTVQQFPRAQKPPPGRGGLAGLFRERQFRWLYISNTTFFLAMQGQLVVRAWLVFSITGRELALGLVTLMVALAMLSLGPVGGVVADRFERRSLVVAGQTTVVVAELVVLSLLLSGRLEFWHILVQVAFVGAVFPFVMPARNAIIANVVGRRRLTGAMALTMTAMNVTRVVGPAVAGALIGAAGVSVAYLTNVVLYALALAGMMAVGRAPVADRADSSLLQNMAEGFRYVRENRLVLVLLFFGLVPMFLVMPFQTLLVVFAEEIWEVGPRGFGLLSGAAGIGGVVGAAFVAWRSNTSRRLRLMMVSVFAFGLLMMGFALSPWFWLALPLLLAGSAFQAIYTTLNNTAIHVLIPDSVRGRVSGFLTMSFSLPMLGAVPISALAEVWGAPLSVGLASLLAVVVAVVFYLASPDLRRMDLSILKAFREAIVLDSERASGARPASLATRRESAS
ncbi:MAG: MFS transporter [Acidobacteriota bacterium]|nr:MFS transporter [Acidobacteriota bacterium]MDE3264288.1 MFS transporter [Acidobacteriota bacterium]